MKEFCVGCQLYSKLFGGSGGWFPEYMALNRNQQLTTDYLFLVTDGIMPLSEESEVLFCDNSWCWWRMSWQVV